MGAFGDKLEITIKGEGANGIVVIDLFEEIAPLHVERMLALASNGNYDGIVFHRVIEGFMAQTGDVQFGKLGDNIENAGRGGSSMPDLVAEFQIYRLIEVLLVWRELKTQIVQTASFL